MILTVASWSAYRFLRRLVQFASVAQSCPNFCEPINSSTPGFPVDHQLLELPKTHVHRVVYAIQPSHPLSSLSPPVVDLSQYLGLFQEINSSHLWPFNPVLIDMLPEFTKIVSLCSPGFFQEISSQTCDIRTSWLSNSPYPLIQHFFKILFYF